MMSANFPVSTVPTSFARPIRSAALEVALQNDDPRSVELGLVCSDLADVAADHRQRIPASCLRLAPARLRIAPQGVGRVVVSLDIPIGAQPGTYRALLHSPELTDLCAFVMVTISPPRGQEEQVMR